MSEAAESPWRVPLSDLLVSEDMLQAVTEAVASGWWSMGPRVGEFERAYAEFAGSRHAIAVANGTAALHLGLLAVGCGPDDDVVLPSLNFVAAANAVAHTGATPVFCDIAGEDDLNLDTTDLEAALSPATKAVVVLHYGGFPCDLEAVTRLCADRGIALIEDAAHAPGSRVGGRMCGTIGAVGCFSFFSNKNLPVGEGGMIVTDDDGLADSLRLLRSHGMTTLTWDRHRGHAHSYDVVARGFNYRLDEVRSAMGLVQLGRLESDNAARARLASRYQRALAEADGLLTLPFADRLGDETYSHHLAVVLVRDGRARDAVRARLAEARVQTSVHYPPIHRFSQYRELGEARPLPRTDDVAERLITLPLYAHMTDEDADYVVDALLRAVRH
jgi:dTDP-4-amino-4,6-dideoxygalactose transaminase